MKDNEISYVKEWTLLEVVTSRFLKYKKKSVEKNKLTFGCEPKFKDFGNRELYHYTPQFNRK